MKCGHCRRSPPLRKFSATAQDGSAVVACICGKQWVKPAPKKRGADDTRHLPPIVRSGKTS